LAAPEKRADAGKAGARKRIVVKKTEAGTVPRENPAETGYDHRQRSGTAGRRDGPGGRDGQDGPHPGGTRAGYDHGSRDDDGTMYNPFAEAFRKMQEKKGRR
jgi:uncharacterized protein